MPSAIEPKAGVVLLDTRDHTPEHEHGVHLKLVEGLARLLGCSPIQPTQQPDAADAYYYLPTETLIDPRRYAALGICYLHNFFFSFNIFGFKYLFLIKSWCHYSPQSL